MCATLGTVLHLTGRQLSLIERAAPGARIADFVDAAYDGAPADAAVEPVPGPYPQESARTGSAA